MSEKENSTIQTPAKAVQLVETAISEVFQAPGLSESERTTNAFGRQVVFSKASDLSFLNGAASTGLRAAALLNGKDLTGNYNQLLAAVRQHLATVAHCNTDHNAYHTVAGIGCFQMFASSAQEAADFTMIAHRIAELALIPGICASDGSEAEIDLPSKELISNYLGDPDDAIDCPTPAQQMIFGGKRKRVPNWFSLDSPMALGSIKDDQAQTFEAAADRKYFYDHLPELVLQAFNEFNNLSGKNYASVVAHRSENAEHLILTQGAAFQNVAVAVDALRTAGQKVGCLNLSVLRPFPIEELLALLKGNRSVTVLENTNGKHSSNTPIYKELLAALQVNDLNVIVLSGQYGGELREEDIKAVFENAANTGKNNFYLGMDFTRSTSKFPKHEVLLGNIRRAYPELQERSLTSSLKHEVGPSRSLDLPHTIRQYKDHGPAYTKLSRFFDDTGYFYKTGATGELVADPFQAIPAIPPATANFANLAAQRTTVPQFNPENCTGCGDCFVNCPHSAIPPIAIGMEALIKSGADIATKKGVPIVKITPQVKNLAKFSAEAISKREDISKVGDFLEAGFNELVEKVGLEGDKLEEIRSDLNAILEVVSEFPSAKTAPFFEQPNAQENGSGELFSLAIDPHACTGCGVCVRACNDEALEMVEQTPELLGEMQATFQLWEQLPDTSGDTINRMHHDEDYDPFAAILLSRSYYMSMTGGSRSEADAPSKALMHLITAATESAVQPRIIEQIKEIDALIGPLNENIHKKLSEALPKENFDVLDKAMKSFQGEMTPFDALVGKMGEKDLMKQVDTNVVKRKVELTKALKDLKWALSEGPTGTGRSRYGMALVGATTWASEFPYNNFTSPTAIQWDGATPELALGLFHGQLRYLLDNIKLLRRAKLEAKDKYDPDRHDAEIARLSWNDLSDDEKALAPPILVVGDKSAMNDRNWAGMNNLLSCNWPIKVIIVDNAQIDPSDSPSVLAQNTTTLLSAIALKNAFVLQGSMADPSHMFNGILEGMQSAGPALFSVFAADPKDHVIADGAWPKLAHIALNSRAFPALLSNPNGESNFLSSSIHLETNPSANEEWHKEVVTYNEGGENNEDSTLEYTITWADWAYTQQDLRKHFTEFDGEDGLPIAAYIALEESARNARTAIIMRTVNGELVKYAVSQEIVAATETVLAAWNTWRELAGTLTEFPEKLKKHVKSELSTKYEKDLAQAKNEFEIQLKEQEQVQVETIRRKLKEKLVALSKQGVNQ